MFQNIELLINIHHYSNYYDNSISGEIIILHDTKCKLEYTILVQCHDIIVYSETF